MKLLHQIFGILVVVVFLLTGQYMDFYYPDKTLISEGMRMMLRSRHIYILLGGLVNIAVGAYFSWHRESWRKALQMAGSILLLIATLFCVGAFFYEPQLDGLQRTLTLPSLIGLLTGTLMHLLSGVKGELKSSSE